jgi:hypothetical protein
VGKKTGMGSGEWGMGKKKGVGDRELKEEIEKKWYFFPHSSLLPHSPFPTLHSPIWSFRLNRELPMICELDTHRSRSYNAPCFFANSQTVAN